MAVIIDIAREGHPPKNKPDVGSASRSTRCEGHGRDVAWSGPMYKRVHFKKGEAHLWFDHACG
jgi:hypothetical protein